MHPLRTRFKKQIIAEFFYLQKRSNRVVIFCDGMPGMPRKEAIAKFFAKKGYWFFQPRYRGTWESGGRFLKISPDRDVLDVVSQLPRGFDDARNGNKYRIKSPEIYLIGVSFGGAAVLLASRDKRVKKIIAISPVVDWRAESKAEPLERHVRFTKNTFGEAYRYEPHAWNKLKTGKFYNPAAHADEIDGKKLLLIHAKDDRVVTYGPVKKFTEKVGAKLITLKRGGHLSSSIVMKPRFWRQIKTFLK